MVNVHFQVVFYEQENVGYKYKYSVSTPGSVRIPKYHWEQVNWEECSVRCGGGEQAAKFSCVEEKAGKVSDSFCESLPSPEKKSRVCNQQKCRTKYFSLVFSWLLKVKFDLIC